MTADVELLPCPFCGNEVQDDEGCFQSAGFRSTATPVWSVRCGSPGCNADVSATSEAAAIAAWNARAQATAAKDAEFEELRRKLAEYQVAESVAFSKQRVAEARVQRLAEALRHLRNHTSVNSHQIELIDAALPPTNQRNPNDP